MSTKISNKKACCFIGHRALTITDEFTKKLSTVIEQLITDGITIFNFGSHSQFDDLCYEIVSKQQKRCSHIQRKHYCVAYENYSNAGINNLYEQEIDCESAISAGKKSYLIRNQIMIDNSDICVFYYNKDYQPPQRKNSKSDLISHQSKSGTAIAFQYAKNKNKVIINIGVQNEFN